MDDYELYCLFVFLLLLHVHLKKTQGGKISHVIRIFLSVGIVFI